MYYLSTNTIKDNIDHNMIGKSIPLHIDWIKKMLTEGIVLQAGKWGEKSGITIVEADSIEEAISIVKRDPLISSGLVTYEIGEFLPHKKLVL